MIVKPVGIENVVNWQDNGIFADTQKPVADDNYTLAGDVNQDNLYVGYMKEHGLKGKLSLPVLSSLGAITGRQAIGDCEVYKHVNGTTIIKGAVINQNLPDSRISLGFSADKNGLQYYNNPNDPMPIKTINMAGLQKWEETDDYIIYVDKDAVMTTVQNYVSGTYDLFLERKANVDGAMELLKENGIEWTAEDDSKLLQDINLAQLEKIMSFPSTLEEEFEPQTLEARTVPTTYDCCFRTDKKSGEIYIGEGYENLFSSNTRIQNCLSLGFDSNGYLEVTIKENVSIASHNISVESSAFSIGDSVFIFAEIISGVKELTETSTRITVNTGNVSDFKLNNSSKDRSYVGENNYKFELFGGIKNNAPFTILYTLVEKAPLKNFNFKIKYIATKTSTQKPFVKSVMPSGKLSFVTNATSETHSFVMNGITITDGSAEQCYLLGSNNISGDNLLDTCYIYSSSERPNLVLISKKFNNSKSVYKNGFNGKAVSIPRHSNLDERKKSHSFKQLLIYKGNLTEAELKAENEKEINVGAYYHQENSVPLTYGIDSMKSMRVYSPALTDTEIAEEVNKNIYIPENRDGVPNYLGEVK